ncbi:MAG: hypothetical protein U0841_08805 [Chloroflexia bacterium]
MDSRRRRGAARRWRSVACAIVLVLALMPGSALVGDSPGGAAFAIAPPRAVGTVWTWGGLDLDMWAAGAVQPDPECPLIVPPPGKGEPFPDPRCPARILGLPDATAFAAGIDHSLVLDTTGRVWAWGDDTYGQLGIGPDSAGDCHGLPCAITPVRLPAPTNVVALAAGNQHSLALAADGTVWAWGDDTFGELGDGPGAPDGCAIGRLEGPCALSPVRVAGLTDVVAIAAGNVHSLALKSDGTVWAWGDDDDGQLGDGPGGSDTCATGDMPFSCATSPIVVPGLSSIVAIAGGGTHSLAVDRAGRVWAWGFDFFGQVGDGPGGPDTCLFLTERDPCAMSPVPVAGLGDVVAVAGGWYHSLALDRAGRVWAWGRGDLGQLGGGQAGPDTVEVDRPGLVVGLGDAVAIAAGEVHSAALRRDGTIWTWGGTDAGQPGDGTGAPGTCAAGSAPCVTSPVRVRGLVGVVAITSGAHGGLALVATEAAPSALPSPRVPGMPPTGGGGQASASEGGRVRWWLLAAVALAASAWAATRGACRRRAR